VLTRCSTQADPPDKTVEDVRFRVLEEGPLNMTTLLLLFVVSVGLEGGGGGGGGGGVIVGVTLLPPLPPPPEHVLVIGTHVDPVGQPQKMSARLIRLIENRTHILPKSHYSRRCRNHNRCCRCSMSFQSHNKYSHYKFVRYWDNN
jgi:hypothetical protein